MAVKEFVYLGSLIHSTTGSTCDISRQSAITRAAMQSLENQIWRSRLVTSTKLKLYNTCILPIFLYGSDCWTISKTDALDQWCLCMLHQMVPVCSERWCMEANQATQTHCNNPVAPMYPVWAYYVHGRQLRCQEDLVSRPSGGVEKTPRSSSYHMAQHRPTGSEATPPYTPRSSRFGSEPPSVEDDVDVWRYALVSCMPETTIVSSEQET